ncbi:LOW QUALITY PROTEIN: S-adenosylmethionine decarboxylase proenzyme-like [Crassostrea angulata]|uniref:LOW QUALITY PROTEIN: S-adenosylmethionine decarboxylase proenzyme-like n=1 Tax=Magallana angulata TaxID=2784310 RepID=UPI0022B217D2|nr:LOW QUALITY PROTEIN: S-adenosylmethionine decarboxylase proenzyme-like [Crassostrea angulata]
MAGASSQVFFEGTEKLLEVWFSSDSESPDLRDVKQEEWEKLLRIVRCEIISKTSNADMDAYVLSESSMFVTKSRFILKTCGRTTLLLAVEPLIQLVKEQCGFSKVLDVFYSRKKFAKPEQQHSIHQSFDEEVSHLDKLFKSHFHLAGIYSVPDWYDGAAYTLGRINKDCWHLYTMDAVGVMEPDQTVELLMWEMCPDTMQIFTKKVCKDGPEATKKSGICDIIPGVQIDDFLFDPCGYSMNGLLPGGYYITIHVTPEPHCSYVSFESNVPQENYMELMEKVLNTFKPSKFLMTVFANKESIAKDNHKQLENKELVPGYTRADHQFCTFKNYNLTYSHFTRPII